MGGFFFNATNQFLLQKLADNSLHFTIVTSAGTSDLVVAAADYGWRAADWVHIIIEWDDAFSLANQQRLYINGREPIHTDPTVDYNSGLLTPDTDFYLGNISGIGSATFSEGIYDEVYAYSLSAQDTSAGILAHAGQSASPVEFLASPSNNATLSLSVVNATRQGEYLYVAADSRFRGLNVVLATAGVGTANLQWQFWNGTAWTDSRPSRASATPRTTSNATATSSGRAILRAGARPRSRAGPISITSAPTWRPAPTRRAPSRAGSRPTSCSSRTAPTSRPTRTSCSDRRCPPR
jgi:hypothetical protein